MARYPVFFGKGAGLNDRRGRSFRQIPIGKMIEDLRAAPDLAAVSDSVVRTLVRSYQYPAAFVARYEADTGNLPVLSAAADDPSLEKTLSAQIFSLDASVLPRTRSPRSGVPAPDDSESLSALNGNLSQAFETARANPGVTLVFFASEGSFFSPSFPPLRSMALFSIPSRDSTGPQGFLAILGESPEDFIAGSPGGQTRSPKTAGGLSDSYFSGVAGALREPENESRFTSRFQQELSLTMHVLEESGDLSEKEILSLFVARLSPFLDPVVLLAGASGPGETDVRILAFSGPLGAWLGEGDSGQPPEIWPGDGLVQRARMSGTPQRQVMSNSSVPKELREKARKFSILENLTAEAHREGGESIILSAWFGEKPDDIDKTGSLLRMAIEIASFLDRRSLKKRVGQLTDYQEAIRTIQQAFLSVREKSELFGILVRTIEAVTDSLAVYVLIRPSGADGLALAAHATKDERLAKAMGQILFPLSGEGPASRTVAARAYREKTVLIESFSNGLDALRFYQATNPAFGRVRSILAIPVQIRGRENPEAVLAVWSDEEDYFAPDLVTLLQQLADSLALAIERLDREVEREHLSLVAEKTSDGILLTDAGGKILWANRAFEKKFGWPLEEIKGKFPADFRIGPETHRETLERIRVHAKNGRSFEETMVHYAKDGTPFWIRVNATALRTPEGEPAGYVSVETDVTALKESEEQVRIASLFYQALSETMQTLRDPSDLPQESLLKSLVGRLKELLGAHLLFLGRLSEGRSEVQELASAGPVEEWLKDSPLSSDPGQSGGRGPAGIALRTGQPQVYLAGDPDTPAALRDRGIPQGIAGTLNASALRQNGDRILFSGQFPDDEFLSRESAGLFQRIVVEIAAFLDRKAREIRDLRLKRYQEAGQKILVDLFAAGNEGEIYRILAETLTLERGILWVDILVPGKDQFERQEIRGPLGSLLSRNPLPPTRIPEDARTLPLPTRIVRERVPLVVRHPAGDRTMPDFYRTPPFSDVDIVAGWPLDPVSKGDLPFAVLTMGAKNARDFDDGIVLELMNRLTGQAALAIDRIRILRRMEDLAVLDPLTGLLNRRGLGLSLQHFLANIRRHREVAILGILDLDDFKPINDSYGHPAGDALLVELSRRLSETLRENDLVARLGGDEFVVVTVLKKAEDLAVVMDRLLESLNWPYIVPGGPSEGVRVGVSMGLTLYPGDNSDPDGLLRHADEALYLIKKRKHTRSLWWALWKEEGEDKEENSNRPDSLSGVETLFFSDCYGEIAAGLIKSVGEAFEKGTKNFSDLFYQTLAKDPRVREILGRLSPSDMARLKENQSRHLRMILSSDLKEEEHRTAARFLGRIHAMTGVSAGGMVEAMRVYLLTLQESIRRVGGDFGQRSRLLSLVTHRLGIELEEQVNGMTDLESGRQSILTKMADEIPQFGNWPDFVRRLLDRLEGFDGMATAAFVRPGEGPDDFMVEFSAENFPGSPEKDLPSGEGGRGTIWSDEPEVRAELFPLLARVWREETLTDIPGTLGDVRLPVSGAVLYAKGIRSLVLLPLKDTSDDRFAILVLGSSYPGYFETSSSRTFLSGLASFLTQGWSRFTRSRTSGSGRFSHQDLRRLLSAGRVSFQYQPVVDLASGRSTKVELLSRMESGTGSLSPAQFLPAFGRSELVDLFRQGLEGGLRQLRLWEEQGLAMDLAINLPPVVLVEPGLIRWLSQGLLATGISASRLHLELLESEEHSDITRQIGRFSEIADLGIHLDMDDLGSGYSSLLRLRSVHFDAVKIDQGLVRGYAVDPSRLVALMGSLVKLVQGLGHSAIIEGLESPSLVEAARILGADGGQGFHFSPPLSSGQVPEWTRAFYLSPRPEPPVSGLGREARLWLDRQYGNRRMKNPDG